MTNETVLDKALRENFELDQKVKELESRLKIYTDPYINDACEVRKDSTHDHQAYVFLNGHCIYWCFKHNRPAILCEKIKMIERHAEDIKGLTNALKESRKCYDEESYNLKNKKE